MSNDLMKLPNNVVILHVLLDKVHELIISDDLLIFIFIDRGPKFNVFLIGVATLFMLIDVFNNTGAETLAIFSFIHEKVRPTRSWGSTMAIAKVLSMLERGECEEVSP